MEANTTSTDDDDDERAPLDGASDERPVMSQSRGMTSPRLTEVRNMDNMVEETRRVNLVNLLMTSSIFLLQNAAFSIYYSDVTETWNSPDVESDWFISRSCFIGCYLVSCVFSPVICQRKISTKQSFLIGSLTISGLVLAQLAPLPHTLIPMSVIGGILLPLYFTAQGTMLSASGHKYGSPLDLPGTNESSESDITLFHALFHCLYLAGPLVRSFLRILILNVDTGHGSHNRTCGFETCAKQTVHTEGLDDLAILPR